VRERMHWVAAEATAAAAALWAVTGDAACARWYEVWWDLIATCFVDREFGSWHHELDPSNVVSATVWPGKPDLYHAVQATLLPRLPLSRSIAGGLAAGDLLS
jgi:sulfoquinovose isomerase